MIRALLEVADDAAARGFYADQDDPAVIRFPPDEFAQLLAECMAITRPFDAALSLGGERVIVLCTSAGAVHCELELT